MKIPRMFKTRKAIRMYIICTFVLSVLFSIVTCSEWDRLRWAFAEAAMSQDVSFLYARLVDQDGNVIGNTRVVASMIKKRIIPDFRMTFYEDTFLVDGYGYLRIAPRGDFAGLLRLVDDAYAPIYCCPIGLRGGNTIDTPAIQESLLKYNGLPDKPMTLRIWKKVGLQNIRKFQLKNENGSGVSYAWKHIKPVMFCIDPFTGTQIEIKQLESATHAVILREWYEQGWNPPKNSRDVTHPQYMIYFKGMQSYILDERIHGKHSPFGVHGVFPDLLQKNPIMYKKAGGSMSLVLKSESSSASAIFSMSSSVDFMGDLGEREHSLYMELLVNPNGTSFEHLSSRPHYNDRYTWKGCKNREEYLAIDPTYPDIKVMPIKKTEPVFDPDTVVPPEYDRKPRRYIEVTSGNVRLIDEGAQLPNPSEKIKE